MKFISITLLGALLCVTIVSASPADDLLTKFIESDSVSAVVEKVKCLTKAIREPLQHTRYSSLYERAERNIKILSKQFLNCLDENTVSKKAECIPIYAKSSAAVFRKLFDALKHEHVVLYNKIKKNIKRCFQTSSEQHVSNYVASTSNLITNFVDNLKTENANLIRNVKENIKTNLS